MKFIKVAILKDIINSNEDTYISEDDFKALLDKYGEEWFYDRAEGWTKAEEEEEYENDSRI